MSKSINRVTLLGNLGRDAETYFTPAGASVTKFSVATSRSWKDQTTEEWKEHTDWTNVVVWHEQKLAPQLLKGKQVYVEGRLQTRDYEKDGRKAYTTEVVADQVIVLGDRNGGHTRDSGNKPISAQPDLGKAENYKEFDPLENSLRNGMVPQGDSWVLEEEKNWGELTIAEDGAMRKSKVPSKGDWREFYANVRDALLGKAPLLITPQQALDVMVALELAAESSAKRCAVPWRDVPL